MVIKDIYNSCDITAKGSCCTPKETERTKKDLRKHWNTTYSQSQIEKLGWYEDNAEPSVRLIRKAASENKNMRMLHVGTGASTLIDQLINEGYNNIIANDLSEKALDVLKKRLGNKALTVKWINDDLLEPKILNSLKPVDLWHDRAVLHFFVNESDRIKYFDLIKNIVRPGGYVIIAAFNKSGATSCSGLEVYRYCENEISKYLGRDFELIEHFNHMYIMPSGNERPYIYTLYKRKNRI